MSRPGGQKLTLEYLEYRAWTQGVATLATMATSNHRKPAWVHVAEELLRTGMDVCLFCSSNTGTKYLRIRHAGRTWWARFANHPRNPRYRRVEFDAGFTHRPEDIVHQLRAQTNGGRHVDAG